MNLGIRVRLSDLLYHLCGQVRRGSVRSARNDLAGQYVTYKEPPLPESPSSSPSPTVRGRRISEAGAPHECARGPYRIDLSTIAPSLSSVVALSDGIKPFIRGPAPPRLLLQAISAIHPYSLFGLTGWIQPARDRGHLLELREARPVGCPVRIMVEAVRCPVAWCVERDLKACRCRLQPLSCAHLNGVPITRVASEAKRGGMTRTDLGAGREAGADAENRWAGSVCTGTPDKTASADPEREPSECGGKAVWSSKPGRTCLYRKRTR